MKTNLYQIRSPENKKDPWIILSYGEIKYPHQFYANDMVARWKKSLPRPGVEPESSRPQRDVLTTRPSKHLPTVLFFFFHKVLSLEVTPWRVHRDSLLCNLDRASPKGEGLRYDAINNLGGRVYRNTWCNAGTQRTSSRTKDTFGNPYRIWRWKRMSALCCMDWENLDPSSFLMTSWMGDTPLSPLWRHTTSRHVCWFELYLYNEQNFIRFTDEEKFFRMLDETLRLFKDLIDYYSVPPEGPVSAPLSEV